METLTKPKQDAYSIFTNWLIGQLEQGIIPWRHSWTETGVPQNLITRQPYRGISTWYLASKGYSKNYYLSPQQVKDLGGTVKKSEKPLATFLFNSGIAVQESDALTMELLIAYELVYNISQCAGILSAKIPAIKSNTYSLFICQEIERRMPKKPEIHHHEQKAYYDALFDCINMPVIESYEDVQSYYTSLFYELIHATGHVSRLNRHALMEMHPYGLEPYSTEELIADIAVSYLKSYAGITTDEFRFNGAFREGWLERLRKEPYLIFYASMEAQKAVEYLLNLTDEEIGD